MKIVKESKENVENKIHLFTNIRVHDILYHRKHKLYIDAVFRQTRLDIFESLPSFYAEFTEIGSFPEIEPICIGIENEIDFFRTFVYS